MKSNSFYKIALMTIACFVTAVASAQEVRVYVGSAAPTGSYRNYASRGVNLGTKVDFQVKPHLCLVTSVDLFYNKLQPMVNSSISASKNGYTSTLTPVSINVPLMVHAKFTTKASKQSKDNNPFDLWGEGAIGLNRRYLTQEKFTAYEFSPAGTPLRYDGVNSFDAKTTLAHQWGVGVTYRNRVSLGFMWYSLGRAKMTGTSTITYADTGAQQSLPFDNGRLKIRYRALRLGISF